MAVLAEFSIFPALPAELRLMVWERVPQPARVVGLLPPSAPWYDQNHIPRVRSNSKGRHDEPDSQTPWNLRFVVQPRDAAIFPPLHANRESRAAWLPRYFQPRQYLQFRTHGEDGNLYTVRFDAPFISYETDIFTVFESWVPSLFIRSDMEGHIPVPDNHEELPIDPFLGLESGRIRHVGLCEIPYDLEIAILTLNIMRLPALRTLSILTLGPDVLNREVYHQRQPGVGDNSQASSSWLEMPAVDVQDLDCELRDVPPGMAESHPFLNTARPRHPVAYSPEIRPLPQYVAFAKSFLWHAWTKRWSDINDIQVVRGAWWDFIDYLSGGPGDANCPLPLEGCGAGGHSREEMVGWAPEFDVDHKLLCARQWVKTLEELGVFGQGNL